MIFVAVMDSSTVYNVYMHSCCLNESPKVLTTQ